ncbi:Cro/CI family transcriptional regulator [Gammaproteobacteria bacterium AS21]
MTEEQRKIKCAIKIFGTQSNFAKAVGVSQGMVSFWLRGTHLVTWQQAIKVEEVTEKKVTRHQLRPDIFGHAE